MLDLSTLLEYIQQKQIFWKRSLSPWSVILYILLIFEFFSKKEKILQVLF